MGFDINEKINTELHYKDIALIAVALGEYQEGHKKTADKEILQRAANIVNRLDSEMANTEDVGKRKCVECGKLHDSVPPTCSTECSTKYLSKDGYGFKIGQTVKAKCTAIGRYIGKGKCVYISAMCNDRCIDDVDNYYKTVISSLPLVDDEELKKYIISTKG